MAKGWFGPKTVGWGVSPKSWQGWLVTLGLLLGVAASTRWLGPALSRVSGIDTVFITPMIVVAWLAAYLLIIWLTYEKKA